MSLLPPPFVLAVRRFPYLHEQKIKYSLAHDVTVNPEVPSTFRDQMCPPFVLAVRQSAHLPRRLWNCRNHLAQLSLWEDALMLSRNWPPYY